MVVAVVLVLRRQLLRERRGPEPQHRPRLPRAAGRVPDPVERLPPEPAGAATPCRGPPEHPPPVDHGHRAGHGPRDADRRRPAVAELRPALGGAVYVEIVRNVPLLAIVVLAYAAIVLNGFPPPNESWQLGPIAVVNVRGASVFGYQGDNGRRSSPAIGLILACGGCPLPPPCRRRDRATGVDGLWAIPATAVVSGRVLGRVRDSAPPPPSSTAGGSAGGITMSPAYFAALLRRGGLHGEPHRRDRPSVDPGRARGQGEAAQRPRCRGSNDCGTWCSPRRRASRSPRSATSTSPDEELVAGRRHQLPRAHQDHPAGDGGTGARRSPRSPCCS